MPDELEPNEQDWQRLAAAAYARIYDRLPACRKEIFDILRDALQTNNPELTANEIRNLHRQRYTVNGRLDNGSTRTRLNELYKMKFIAKCGPKLDPESGMMVTAFRAFRPGESMPESLKKGPTRRAIEAMLRQAEEERDNLLEALATFIRNHPEFERELCAGLG